jgi:hypothetical protein
MIYRLFLCPSKFELDGLGGIDIKLPIIIKTYEFDWVLVIEPGC